MVSTAQSSYTVTIPVYEGPLALLLDLIERAELDITSVSLAQVTDQYLAYVRTLQQVTADEISSFLVIASKLIQIKSEALLPRPPVREVGEVDPAEDLARQLRLYKRYKEIGVWLEDRQSRNLRTFLRVAPPPKVEAKLDLSDITLADLLEAAERIFAAEQEKQSLGTVITAPKITIREKIRIDCDSAARRTRRHLPQSAWGKSHSVGDRCYVFGAVGIGQTLSRAGAARVPVQRHLHPAAGGISGGGGVRSGVRVKYSHRFSVAAWKRRFFDSFFETSAPSKVPRACQDCQRSTHPISRDRVQAQRIDGIHPTRRRLQPLATRAMSAFRPFRAGRLSRAIRSPACVQVF